MRAFISINLSDALHRAIRELHDRLDGEVRGIRWIPAENCHLTLKFLGDTPEPLVQTIAEELRPIGSAFDPFPIELGGIGQFPPRGPLSVLWVGLKSGEAVLRALEQSIQQVLDNAKVSFDRKPFSPHLTIGRPRRGEQPFLRATARQPVSLGAMQVDAFCLMESVLQPSGPIYTVRHRFPLGGEPAA